jgi:hypothetical protein
MAFTITLHKISIVIVVAHHKNGKMTYSHSAITPVIVSPESHLVISLEPEFIRPQDGHNKIANR